jgi:putative sterol carrier protein
MKMNGQKGKNRYKLGDLIAALFEEARVITTDRGEQTVLVYAALKDLLQGKVRPAHPVALRVGTRMTTGH